MMALRSRASIRRPALLGIWIAAIGYPAAIGCSSSSHEDASATGAQAVSSAGLVISGVYGGGGNTGATFTNDFVELFNSGASPISLQGMSLQYGSANADFASPVALPNVSVAPGRYFLVKLASGGSTGAALPAEDHLATSLNLAATSGKVALASVTTALACGGATRCATASIVDMVGYGAASDYAGPTGSAVPALSDTTAAYRRGAGCTNTNVNSADFASASPATAPRNQSTTAAPCAVVGTDAGGTDSALPPEASLPDSAPPSDGGTLPSGDGDGLVISQVYGGGGATGTFGRGFVEIFNRAATFVSTSDLALQVANSSGDFGASPAAIAKLPTVLIPAGGYYLVGLGTAGTGTGLPATDLEAPTLSLDPVNSKVALAKSANPLGCGGAVPCLATAVVDLVGYGTASDFEGTGAVAALSATTGATRKNAGCTDVGDNAQDFDVATPKPRSGATAPNVCGGSSSSSSGSSGTSSSSSSSSGSSGASSSSSSSSSSGGSSSGGSSSGGSSGVADSGANIPQDIGGGNSNSGGCRAAGGGSSGNALGGVLAILGVALLRRRRSEKK